MLYLEQKSLVNGEQKQKSSCSKEAPLIQSSNKNAASQIKAVDYCEKNKCFSIKKSVAELIKLVLSNSANLNEINLKCELGVFEINDKEEILVLNGDFYTEDIKNKYLDNLTIDKTDDFLFFNQVYIFVPYSQVDDFIGQMESSNKVDSVWSNESDDTEKNIKDKIGKINTLLRENEFDIKFFDDKDEKTKYNKFFDSLFVMTSTDNEDEIVAHASSESKDTKVIDDLDSTEEYQIYVKNNKNKRINRERIIQHIVGNQKKASIPTNKFFFDPYKLTAFNVGQGNLSILQSKGSKQKIMFDIGFSIHFKKEGDKINNIKKIINGFSGKYVIISHYDLDHIIGATSFDFSKNKNTKWICYNPEILGAFVESLSLSAITLLSFLDAKNVLLFIDPNKVLTLYNDIKLYQGNAQKDLPHCNRLNGVGIISEIKSGTGNSALIPGDCIYSFIPNTVKNSCYNFVIVPHHCCKLDDLYDMKMYVQYAFISSGVNKYGHPDKEHMDKIIKQLGSKDKMVVKAEDCEKATFFFQNLQVEKI